jgi:hypothetical protein
MNTEYDRASALKGFWYRKQSVPYTGRKDYMKNVTKEVHMSSGAQSYLEKIAALAKEKDIPLLLISSPSPKNWTEGKKLAISDWAEQNNVTFIDLNEKLDEIGIDWNTDSLDLGDHVNFNGTLKINQYIGAYLKEQYGLIDHREDSTYQSWTDLYQTTSIYTKQ